MTPKDEARDGLHNEAVYACALKWVKKYREQRTLSQQEQAKIVTGKLQLEHPTLGRKAARLIAESVMRSA